MNDLIGAPMEQESLKWNY